MTNTLYDALLKPHGQNKKPLLILTSGDEVSYGDAVTAAHKIANILVSEGVKPGDRVAVQVDKSPQALFLYFACVAAGAVFLPLNTAYTPSELSYFIGNASPTLVVVDPESETALAPIASEAGSKIQTLGADGHGSLMDLAQGASGTFEVVPRAPHDLAAILYTSGTTGRSKGAMLSHDNLLSNALTLKDLWHFVEDDVLLHALPIYHTHGLFVATNIIMSVGGTMIFLPKFDAGQVLKWIPKATTMMGVPTFYTRLLKEAAFQQELISHFRLFISGSAPLLAETHLEFEARTGHRILERYGMTETNMNTSNPYREGRLAGTVGLPLPDVSLRIVDPETEKEVKRGEVGVIEVKGPNVFSGYWQMPEKTTTEFSADGFFITGDLATQDKQGYVTIVGRAKDLIISGGFNIYPKEVEGLIDEIPGVLESAVFGVPHDDFGEGVLAAVVAKDGVTLEGESLIHTLKKDLANFKVPKEIFMLKELPRNTMGKVQKNLLRERYNRTFKP
jgi:malonyl-CoA/methylmalonyl-CoA synthetase